MNKNANQYTTKTDVIIWKCKILIMAESKIYKQSRAVPDKCGGQFSKVLNSMYRLWEGTE